MKKILTFNTEPEAQVVTELLNQEGINYTIKEHGASNFPGVFEGTHGYADLLVSDDDQEKVVGLIKSKFPEYIFTSENLAKDVVETKRNSFAVPILAILLVAVSVYAIFLLSSKHKLQTALDGATNLDYHGIWDRDFKLYTTFWRETRKMRSEDRDEDYDGSYELIVTYDKQGNKISEYFDNDDNAVFETGREYSKDGRLEAEYIDQNQDMRVDKYTVYAPDFYIYSYIYNPTTGLCEKVVASDSNGTVVNEISFKELGRRIRAQSFPLDAPQ